MQKKKQSNREKIEDIVSDSIEKLHIKSKSSSLDGFDIKNLETLLKVNSLLDSVNDTSENELSSISVEDLLKLASNIKN